MTNGLGGEVRILLSNDDGYLAPGLACLAKHLDTVASISVVAPDRDKSGASHSLTLDNPLRAQRTENGFYRVEGTPTDCVHLAITGLLDFEPDMVISGINAGANMGDDVLYSGTVAAATEGRFLGYPAIAVSMIAHQPQYFDTAAMAVLKVLGHLEKNPLPQDTILNVNVPDLPWHEIQGFQATRLGNRHRSEGVIRQIDPRGRPVYWVGPAGEAQDAGPGTDFYAVSQGFVSVTPLQLDLTRYDSLSHLDEWLRQC